MTYDFQGLLKVACEYIALMLAAVLLAGCVVAPQDLKFLIIPFVGLVHWFLRFRDVAGWLLLTVLAGLASFFTVLWLRGVEWLDVFIFGGGNNELQLDFLYLILYTLFLMVVGGGVLLWRRRPNMTKSS